MVLSIRTRLACLLVLSLFFFQAEDGIRDKLVTGVQTCALPIYPSQGMLNRVFSHMEKTRFNIPWLGSVLASADTDAYSVNCGSRCSMKSFGRSISASTIKKASPTACCLANSRFSE